MADIIYYGWHTYLQEINFREFNGGFFIMFKLYYEKRKSKTGNYFDVIYVDLEYRKIFLCFDRSVIAEMLGCTVADIYAFAPETKIQVGTVDGSAVSNV